MTWPRTALALVLLILPGCSGFVEPLRYEFGRSGVGFPVVAMGPRIPRPKPTPPVPKPSPTPPAPKPPPATAPPPPAKNPPQEKQRSATLQGSGSHPEQPKVNQRITAKDIKSARPYGPDGRPGHPDAHGVSRQDQADIINDSKTTVHRGTNANGRPVDHYHRDGTTVITEQADPARAITAFGKFGAKDNKGHPIQRGTGKPANPEPSGGPYEKLR